MDSGVGVEENAKGVRKLFGDGEYVAPDTVLECTGVESSVLTACHAARRGGRVVVIGVGKSVMHNFPFMHLSMAEVCSSLFLPPSGVVLLTGTDRYQIYQSL